MIIQHYFRRIAASAILASLVFAASSAAESLAGRWDAERAQPILDKTLTLTLDPDLSHLSAAERRAVDKLLAAGALVQTLYERQKHAQAESALAELRALDAKEAAPLLTLYRLSSGPIVTTLDNQRLPFLPVAPETPGKNVYPPELGRDELDAFLAAHPERRDEILDVRSVVRRADAVSLDRDLAALAARPVADRLHPGLRDRWEELRRAPASTVFYAVPYSLAYAAETDTLYDLLVEAADAVADVDADFAAYLRNRARDLLADDYEAGDASWVSGSFGNLNAQIGSYETYDDELYGVKSFYSLSLLLRDRERSDKLARAVAGLQAIEDSLPYERHKRVREGIPVGVYHVIADFGQARGTNTATILPNDADHARKYGRTILMRYNVLTHPELFALTQARFRAAVAPAHYDDLTLDAGFERTLWHEIGHYLGVDRTADGRVLDEALEQYSDLLEEMKSDLVSLFAARALKEAGYYSEEGLRSVYASGVRRVVQEVRPRREQPYQTMQLMQWNFFMEHGLLRFDAATGELHIDYARYHEVVTALLREVLAVQSSGDPQRAAAFVERWGQWRDDLHEVVAERLREALRYRFRLVRYGVLDR